MFAVVLLLLPAALLFALLSFGLYPGERFLEPVGQGRWSPRFVAVAAEVANRKPTTFLLPRGGRLVAHAMAGRAPPRF